MASSSSSSDLQASKPVNETFTIPFHTGTLTLEWEAYIHHLQKPENNPMGIQIIDRLIAFKDGKSKQFYLNSVLKKKDDFTPEEFEKYFSNLERAITVSYARAQLRAGGTLFVFNGSATNAVERAKAWKGDREEIKWHAFAAFWKEGVLGIYDPSFLMDNVKVEKDLVGLVLVKQMMAEMRKNRKAIKEVWVGGEGNFDDTCVEKTRAWIEEEVMVKGGVELGIWEGREGWKKIGK